MNKRMVRGLVALVMVGNMASTTQAFAMEPSTDYLVKMQIEEHSVRAEEQVWIYKTVDGVYYKRLWSYTYGEWVTDWIACATKP